MDILSLQQNASFIVRDNQKPPRHIFLIHTLIAVRFPIVLALISEILRLCVPTGGGLSGMSSHRRWSKILN